ncbi:MAG: hypothetical protein JSU70_22880, partial [Phycisphaerales bacterium]
FACNVAVEGGGGIHFTANATGRLTNCTVADNESVHFHTGGIYLETTNTVTLNSSIIWGNSPHGIRPEANPSVSYSCTQKSWSGPGNIGNMVKDPLFAGPGDCAEDCNDYHLKSQAGRYNPCAGLECACDDPSAWVRDDVTSPCIDEGDPSLPFNKECRPNGGRINMGAYGGTCEASKSMKILGDINQDGSVDANDLDILSRNWLAQKPGVRADITSDGIVDLHDYYWVATDWRSVNIVPYLVAYWRLDETSGTVAHEESRDNHATLNNGPVWTEGRINGALLFDGFDDYLDCGAVDSFGPERMTLSMWLRPAQIDRWSGIVARASSAGQTDYALMRDPTGKLQFTVGQSDAGPVSVLSTAETPVNEWSHVAVLLNGSTASICINGQPDASTSYGERVSRAGYSLIIGSSKRIPDPDPRWNTFYPGKIDEIRIYSTALKCGVNPGD